MQLQSVVKPWYLFRPRQALRRILRAMRRPAQPWQIIELAWGCQIIADIRETVGRSLWTAGIYDLAVTEVLYRLTEPNSLALDVGANIGVMTGVMAARGAEVWAFEPYPATYQRLCVNLERWQHLPGFGRCTPLALAASDVDGDCAMECPQGFAENNGLARLRPGAGASGAGATTVRTARLDSLLERRAVSMLKIDVEGHELAVLRGAERVLADGTVRHIVFEEHAGPAAPSCRFLAERGFVVMKIGWQTTGPLLAPLTSSVHRASEAPSYLATRDPAAALAGCSSRGWKCLRRPGRN